jgi:hypothetical protein
VKKKMKLKQANPHKYCWLIFIFLFTAGILCAGYGLAAELEFAIDNPAPIGPPISVRPEAEAPPEFTLEFDLAAPAPLNTFEGIDLNENANLTGFFIIPPDPIAAAGPAHVVSVVNSSIEWYTKSGVLQGSQSLEDDFFGPLAPQARPFDPKVIYDQYADRFVVIALVRVDNGIFNPNNVSRILVAVSDDENPNGNWYLGSINSILTIGFLNNWADYPGLAIDEEAVYITANMFQFQLNGFSGSRLWILEKGDGSGGFYDGGTSSLTLHNPSSEAGMQMEAFTLQPAHVFGPGGVPGKAGTFLVSSGWAAGMTDFLSVIRVDDPLGSPSFSNQFINLGDVTSGFGLPDAPQAGTGVAVETNDGRILNAVWRNNSLWAVNTVSPSTGADSGQATAHWHQIDTSTLNSLALVQQGNVGGEDIAAGTHTFFPAIAVDGIGNAAIGFSASAPGIFPGAYYAGRQPLDPAGTVQPSQTLAAGIDYYIRTFGGQRNRWGDYSGMSVDPADDRTFWAYNEYALSRGTPTNGEDGRWGTRFGSFIFSTCAGDFDMDGDVDGMDLKALIDDNDRLDLETFALEFGRSDCLPE